MSDAQEGQPGKPGSPATGQAGGAGGPGGEGGEGEPAGPGGPGGGGGAGAAGNGGLRAHLSRPYMSPTERVLFGTGAVSALTLLLVDLVDRGRPLLAAAVGLLIVLMFVWVTRLDPENP